VHTVAIPRQGKISAAREEIYRHAARQARAATEHIRKCAMTDPAGAADAAWAAADTLHVAARALRNPHLRCAADSYDRAARAPYGRIPARSRDGEQLRRAARMIALAGRLTGDNTLMAIALIAQFVALAAAVAELRRAQQHAAQARPRPVTRPPTYRRRSRRRAPRCRVTATRKRGEVPGGGALPRLPAKTSQRV